MRHPLLLLLLVPLGGCSIDLLCCKRPHDGVSYAAGKSPFDVATGDFNSDGVIDLAVANYGSADVSILIGVGDGTFGAATNYPAKTWPRSLVTNDLNGDGILDLAVSNEGFASVSILAGNGIGGVGDGTFTSAGELKAGSRPGDLAARDFNGDGFLDLAVTNYASSDVSLFLGDGDASFAAAVSHAAGSSPCDVAAEDFDSDGDIDLLVVNCESGDVSLLVGRGDGTFEAPQNQPAGARPVSVLVVDLDGDGILDMTVASYRDDVIRISWGDGTGAGGDGTFSDASLFDAGPNPRSIVAADFNEDGILDLAVANCQTSGGVSLLLGGPGSSADPISFTLGAGYRMADNPCSLVADDFDSDGVADIAVTNSSGVTILLGSVEIANGLATFGE